MIDNILKLLQTANENNIKGKYIDIALGKYKMPLSFSDIQQNLKRQ